MCSSIMHEKKAKCFSNIPSEARDPYNQEALQESNLPLLNANLRKSDFFLIRVHSR